jgi:hypothetical protein
MSEQDPPLYQIVDWNEHFENHKSRERDQCRYVYIPNHHGGLGMRNVLAEEDGFAIYGAWCCIVQLCSRQRRPRKGWLTVDGKPDGRPLTGDDLARLWGKKPAEIYRVFQVTSRPEVGWVRLVQGHHQWQEETEKEAERPPSALQVPAERPPTVRPLQTSDDQGINGARQVPAERPPGARQVPKKEGKKEDCTLNVTYHNITVRRGELDNSYKTEEEKPWIDALFQTNESWSYEEMELLSQLLPIRPESKRLLIWAYNVPPNNPFFERTKLKQARLFLLREFGAEVDKIRSVRRQMELSPDIAERKKNG